MQQPRAFAVTWDRLELQWSAGADNGSPILNYALERLNSSLASPASSSSSAPSAVPTFTAVYVGLQLSCAVEALSPATEYVRSSELFRVFFLFFFSFKK